VGETRRHIGRDEHALLTDVSALWSVLGVMGPKARELLARVSPDDLSPAALPFSHTKEIDLGHGKPVQSAMSSAPPSRTRWRLQDAKARFSELVRKAHSDGPQHVTVHGRDAVVVMDAEEFHRLKGGRTGNQLIEALQASPQPNRRRHTSRPTPDRHRCAPPHRPPTRAGPGATGLPAPR
jgi:prevent-host-death family protein